MIKINGSTKEMNKFILDKCKEKQSTQASIRENVFRINTKNTKVLKHRQDYQCPQTSIVLLKDNTKQLYKK